MLLYVQSWIPDDGWKDRPKHKLEKIVHLVPFTIEVITSNYESDRYRSGN